MSCVIFLTCRANSHLAKQKDILPSELHLAKQSSCNEANLFYLTTAVAQPHRYNPFSFVFFVWLFLYNVNMHFIVNEYSYFWESIGSVLESKRNIKWTQNLKNWNYISKHTLEGHPQGCKAKYFKSYKILKLNLFMQLFWGSSFGYMV